MLYNFRQLLPLVDFLINESDDFESSINHIVYTIVDDSVDADYLLKYNAENIESQYQFDAHQYRSLFVGYFLLVLDPSTVNQSLINLLTGLQVRDMFVLYCRMINMLEKLCDIVNPIDSRDLQKRALLDLITEISKMSEEGGESKQVLIKFFKDNGNFATVYQLKK